MSITATINFTIFPEVKHPSPKAHFGVLAGTLDSCEKK
jgi:hypothetical protein